MRLKMKIYLRTGSLLSGIGNLPINSVFSFNNLSFTVCFTSFNHLKQYINCFSIGIGYIKYPTHISATNSHLKNMDINIFNRRTGLKVFLVQQGNKIHKLKDILAKMQLEQVRYRNLVTNISLISQFTKRVDAKRDSLKIKAKMLALYKTHLNMCDKKEEERTIPTTTYFMEIRQVSYP